jgi:hypothetical protein
MPEPIKIIVTAETTQAAGALGNFVQQAVSGLLRLVQNSRTAGAEMQKLNTAALESLKGFNDLAAAKKLEELAALRQEIARAQLEAGLRQIQGNPLLTDEQKSRQSIPLYQQQMVANQSAMGDLTNQYNSTSDLAAQLEIRKQINELMVQQADLQNKLNAAQGQDSFTQQFAKVMVQIQNVGTLAQQSAALFKNAWENATSSIGSNFTKLIEGTTTWSRALMNIATSVVNNIISGFVRMAVQWVMNQIMMATMGRAILASATAATAPIAAAQSMIWAAPATLATISSYGGAALAAPGFVAAAEAMTQGMAAFAEGGRPEVGSLALVGERGPELFVPDTAGTIIPAHVTSSLLQGTGSSGAASSPAAGGKTNVDMFTYMDMNKMMEHLHKSDAHEKYVVDVMGKNIRKFT